MDKLKTIGLSALCGSLAAVASATAGEMSISGGATATWSHNSKEDTGNPIGLNSGLTFVGSGELDNGTTFTLTLTEADQAAYSAGSIALTFPSAGSFTIGGATGGTGIGAYDDKMPTAWEETWGTSLGTGIDLAKGSSSSMSLEYATPSIGGVTLKIAGAPGANNGLKANDKAATGAGTGAYQGSIDAVIDISAMGQNLFVGASRSERDPANKSGNNADANDDKYEGVAGLILNIGPVQLGAQATGEYLGNEQTGTDIYGYRNVAYGVAFNVSDNLSLSYGKMESKQGSVSADNKKPVLMTIESFQVAYTMGGASIKIADTSLDNGSYTSGTGQDKDAMTVALSLAF